MSLEKKTLHIEECKFDANGLMPVIVQDYESGEVLVHLYMNKAALEKTFATGYVYHYCREKESVVKFGASLGNTQQIKTAFIDCTGETLLLKVRQIRQAAPERDSFTCFPDQVLGEYKDIGGEMFGRLQRIVDGYKKNPEDGGYTSFLFARGVDRIGKKVGEEAVEFVIASKNPDKQGVVNEAADLLYHTMVLLSARGVKISEVCAELCKRNR
jgi:phosphoribosyl-ATP pyrophosphohydrolase/phosphoribosyl-AMP cyclohydrolase